VRATRRRRSATGCSTLSLGARALGRWLVTVFVRPGWADSDSDSTGAGSSRTGTVRRSGSTMRLVAAEAAGVDSNPRSRLTPDAGFQDSSDLALGERLRAMSDHLSDHWVHQRRCGFFFCASSNVAARARPVGRGG
jgi:hypothetical protein